LFGISGFELFAILLFGFLIFGPEKLPDMARTAGRAIAKFRNAQAEMNEVLKNDVYDPNSDEPFKDPVAALDKLAKIQEEKLGDVMDVISPDGSSKKKESSGDGAAPAALAEPAEATENKSESFTERKARYERERAARKEAEAKKAAEAASEPAAAEQPEAAAPAAGDAAPQEAAGATEGGE